MKLHLLAVCLSLLPACHVAATSPGHRYIVKLCETSWLDREPAETAAALAENDITTTPPLSRRIHHHPPSSFPV